MVVRQSPWVHAGSQAQNDYTRSVLARIPEREDRLKKIKQLDEGAIARVYDIRRLPGERYFYQKRLASQDVGKLYVRNGLSAPEKVIADPVKMTPAGKPAFVLNYYPPALDGKLVPYSAPPAATEDAVTHDAEVAARRWGRDGETGAANDEIIRIPLEGADAAAELAELAGGLARSGNANLRGDATVAVLVGSAAARAGAVLVCENLADASNDPRLARAAALVTSVGAAEREVLWLYPVLMD